MDVVAGGRRPTRFLPLALSGLEAGMIGALWMLAWMGVSSVWQRRSFWTAENLMATAFRRDAPLGGPSSTFPGLALYLLIYSLLGALFALAIRNRVPRARVMLLSVGFGLAWYWISFQWMWKSLMPVVALLHVEQTTMLGHLVYGTVLGRFPAYLARLDPPSVPEVAPPVEQMPPAEVAAPQVDQVPQDDPMPPATEGIATGPAPAEAPHEHAPEAGGGTEPQP